MSDAEFELELVEALNMLLEDERASVEMEVALASGATEYSEREALAAMGTQDIHFCEQLRTEMERAGLTVTPQINGVVFQVIGAERYDDRLRAFAHHQRVVAERARELQESNLEGTLREALEGISLTHDHHTQWTEQRATEFAATRNMEFGGPVRTGFPIGDESAGTGADSATLAGALPAEALPTEVPFVESIERVEPVAPDELDEFEELDEPGAGSGEAFEPPDGVTEPEAEPEVEQAEPASARPGSRARGATKTAGAAKPSTSRAKATRTAKKPSAKSTATPTRRTRRAPKADEDENA